MPKRDRMLGPIQLVLLSFIAADTEGDPCGDTLQGKMKDVVTHQVSAAQVYIALRRMKERGLVTVQKASPTGKRGKPKQLYTITKTGTAAYQEYVRIVQHIAQKEEVT